MSRLATWFRATFASDVAFGPHAPRVFLCFYTCRPRSSKVHSALHVPSHGHRARRGPRPSTKHIRCSMFLDADVSYFERWKGAGDKVCSLLHDQPCHATLACSLLACYQRHVSASSAIWSHVEGGLSLEWWPGAQRCMRRCLCFFGECCLVATMSSVVVGALAGEPAARRGGTVGSAHAHRVSLTHERFCCEHGVDCPHVPIPTAQATQTARVVQKMVSAIAASDEVRLQRAVPHTHHDNHCSGSGPFMVLQSVHTHLI